MMKHKKIKPKLQVHPHKRMADMGMKEMEALHAKETLKEGTVLNMLANWDLGWKNGAFNDGSAIKPYIAVFEKANEAAGTLPLTVEVEEYIPDFSLGGCKRVWAMPYVQASSVTTSPEYMTKIDDPSESFVAMKPDHDDYNIVLSGRYWEVYDRLEQLLNPERAQHIARHNALLNFYPLLTDLSVEDLFKEQLRSMKAGHHDNMCHPVKLDRPNHYVLPPNFNNRNAGRVMKNPSHKQKKALREFTEHYESHQDDDRLAENLESLETITDKFMESLCTSDKQLDLVFVEHRGQDDRIIPRTLVLSKLVGKGALVSCTVAISAIRATVFSGDAKPDKSKKKRAGKDTPQFKHVKVPMALTRVSWLINGAAGGQRAPEAQFNHADVLGDVEDDSEDEKEPAPAAEPAPGIGAVPDDDDDDEDQRSDVEEAESSSPKRVKLTKGMG
jgi:hypothetical protein